ncbi:MAG: hypothetical protein ACRENE_12425 [Polyangiaceae bacterium]
MLAATTRVAVPAVLVAAPPLPLPLPLKSRGPNWAAVMVAMATIRNQKCERVDMAGCVGKIGDASRDQRARFVPTEKMRVGREKADARV